MEITSELHLIAQMKNIDALSTSTRDHSLSQGVQIIAQIKYLSITHTLTH